MRKPKTAKQFTFRDLSHQEMVDLLNSENPISLKHNEDLIDRIHAKYPIISKVQIAIIVRGIFLSIRELLVLGKVLNFNNLFFDTQLLFFDYRKDGHILPSLKVKMSTPPPMRSHDKE